MKTSLIAWLLLFSLPAFSAQPPAQYVAAVKKNGCRAVAWTKVSQGWVAVCHESGQHDAYWLYRDLNASNFSMQKLGGYWTASARRGHDCDLSGSIKVARDTLLIKSNDDTCSSNLEIYSLAQNPPVKLSVITVGGYKMYSRTDDLNQEPSCATDVQSRYQSCKTLVSSCEKLESQASGEELSSREVQYTTIPVTSQTTGDVFSCATTFGNRGSDVYWGKNPNATTFEIVARHAPDDKSVTFYVRLHDRTPFWSTSSEWQNRDHFEIWLAPDVGDYQGESTADQKQYCAERDNNYVQLIFAPAEDGTVKIFDAAHRGIRGASDLASVRQTNPNEWAITLSGKLREWVQGAVTFAYSDSIDGRKQNSLIGNSKLKWGKPETFGHLAGQDLCSMGASASDALETYPW